MGLFRRSPKEAHSEEVMTAEQMSEVAAIEQLQKSTEQIEEEKRQKKLAREERKFYREVAKKRQARERYVAPILLIVTLIISLLVYGISQIK